MGLVEENLKRGWPRWHFDVETTAPEVPDTVRERTLAEANEILRRRFVLIGHRPVTLDPIDWNHAPLGNFWWTRDLNRHACFERLGFAYRYSGDEAFAQTFVELSHSWIEQCSPNIGRLAWDTPFEVGRRINAWIWAFHLFWPSVAWGEEARRRFLLTLGLQAEYLYQTLEYHSPGNHVLLEAKAMALCGEVLPEFAGASSWRKRGWRTLEREIERQICRDGVHAERSTMYHRIVSGELAELWLFCRRNGFPQTEDLEEVVRRMAEFQRWIDLGRGRYPLFGDSRSVDSYYRFSAPAVLDLVDRGEIATPEENAGDHTWWGAWGVRMDGGRWRKSPEEPGIEALHKAFPEGGYYVSRSPSADGPSVLVWDCGPLGYAANRKHGHLDALSFVLGVRGEPILVDLGVGERPTTERKRASSSLPLPVDRRAELRMTRAHNTVTVDEEDQAILSSRSEIWDPPHPRIILWGRSPDFSVMWGRHDGYCRLPDPVVHERLIVTSRSGYWLILDCLTGRGRHTTDLWYHVAAEACIETLADSSIRISKGDSRVHLSLFGQNGNRSNVNTSIEEKLGELRDGKPNRHAVIRGTSSGQVPLWVGTLICLPDTDARAQFLEPTGLSCQVEVLSRAGRDLIEVSGRADNRETDNANHREAQVVIRRQDQRSVVIGTWSFDRSPSAVESLAQSHRSEWTDRVGKEPGDLVQGVRYP